MFLFVIRNVATQAALIAGFAFTCITQVRMPEAAPRGLHIAFNTSMALVLACELHTVIIATLCCTGGPNVAMRGHGACPRESVDRALRGMKSGQSQVYVAFVLGLFFFELASAFIGFGNVEYGNAEDLGFVVVVIIAGQVVVSFAVVYYMQNRFFHLDAIKADAWTWRHGWLRLAGRGAPKGAPKAAASGGHKTVGGGGGGSDPLANLDPRTVAALRHLLGGGDSADGGDGGRAGGANSGGQHHGFAATLRNFASGGHHHRHGAASPAGEPGREVEQGGGGAELSQALVSMPSSGSASGRLNPINEQQQQGTHRRRTPGRRRSVRQSIIDFASPLTHLGHRHSSQSHPQAMTSPAAGIMPGGGGGGGGGGGRYPGGYGAIGGGGGGGGGALCSQCHSPVGRNQAFCPTCGNKLFE